jgi:hypothetical protein
VSRSLLRSKSLLSVDTGLFSRFTRLLWHAHLSVKGDDDSFKRAPGAQTRNGHAISWNQVGIIREVYGAVDDALRRAYVSRSLSSMIRLFIGLFWHAYLSRFEIAKHKRLPLLRDEVAQTFALSVC